MRSCECDKAAGSRKFKRKLMFSHAQKRYRVSDAIYRCVGKKSVEKEHIPFFLWGKEGERSEDNFSCEKA